MFRIMLGMFQESQQNLTTELIQFFLEYASQVVAGGNQRNTRTLKQLGWGKESRGKDRRVVRFKQEG